MILEPGVYRTRDGQTYTVQHAANGFVVRDKMKHIRKPKNVYGDSFFISVWDDFFRIEGDLNVKDAKRLRRWLEHYIAWMEQKNERMKVPTKKVVWE